MQTESAPPSTSLALPLSEIVVQAKRLHADAKEHGREFSYLNVGLNPRKAGRDGGPDMVAALTALHREGLVAEMDGRTCAIQIRTR